jgi:hypothetical protein
MTGTLLNDRISARRRYSSGTIPMLMVFLVSLLCVPFAQAEKLVLSAGWNFVSLPRQPAPSTAINAVLGDASPGLAIIWGYDNETRAWKRYRPGGSSNTLFSMEANKGYWIFMTRVGAIDMTQWTVPSATVPLRAGWNFVGYPGPDDQDLSESLGNISDTYSIIWNWTGGRWSGKLPSGALPSSFQSLQSIDSGKAYWIKTGRSLNWVISGDVGNYFPTATGNRWDYQVTESKSGQDTMYASTISVTGSKSINGVRTKIFMESNHDNSDRSREEYAMKSSQGFAYYGNNDAGVTLDSQMVPYWEVEFPLQTGSSFTQVDRSSLDCGSDLDGDGVNEICSAKSVVTMAGFETVSLPLGTFPNCAKIRTDRTLGVTSTRYGVTITETGTGTEWYAPGIGLIRSTLTTILPGHTNTKTYELTGYKVDWRDTQKIPPSIISVAPVGDISDKDFSAVTVTFSKDMDPSSISWRTFSLRMDGDFDQSGPITYADRKATFIPSGYRCATRYVATLSSSITDVSGNPISSNDFSWSFTTGPCLFLPYAQYSKEVFQGTFQGAVTIGDVNGDGRNDVVATTGHVFLQNRAGGLDPPITYTPSPGYYCSAMALATGDLNNDGRVDLMVGRSGCGPSDMEVFLQNSAGRLDAAIPYATNSSFLMGIADMNNDGLADVVGFGGPLSVWYQNADKTLSSPIVTNISTYRTFDLGDLNNDGRTDIAVTDVLNLGIVLQQPNGSFDAPVYHRLGFIYPTSVAVGDLNGDGLNDVVVAGGNYPDYLVSVFFQNSAGGFNPAANYSSYAGANAITVADVNNDGRKDVIMFHGSSIGVRVQKDDGALAAEEAYGIPYNQNFGPQTLAVGDVNGDGLPDVVVVGDTGLTVLYHAPSP